MYRWLDDAGHIATSSSQAMATLMTLANKRDRLCLEYIKQHAVGRYEPMLIDELTRDQHRREGAQM